MSYSVVVGLGNPGTEYSNTRHNLGFLVLDALATHYGASWKKSRDFKAEIAEIQIQDNKIQLLKPLDYMNRSGGVLNRFLKYYKIAPENVIVVYDDVGLDLGILKISLNSGSGGHNGIQDIINHVANRFVRFRIGIGPKLPSQMSLSDFVLGKFTDNEKSVLTSGIDLYIKGIHFLINNGIEKAMNQFNQRNKINEHSNSK